jgi:hypothetical protein
MTPNGELIGAGTFGGDVLLFEKKSNIPIEQIKINSTIGAFDLSDDGSIFITGSADKKIRIFHKGEGRAKAEIALNEYVGELDISANGRYAVAGTSGSVYFFESIIDLTNVQTNVQASVCTKIIEPPKEDTSLFGGQNSTNNPSLPTPVNEKNILFLPVVISASCTGLFIIMLAVYILVCRIKKLKGKKVILILLCSFILLSLLTTVFFLWKNNGNNQQKTVQTETPGSTDDQNKIGTNICGDGICNPGFGETKENCRKDCTPSE